MDDGSGLYTFHGSALSGQSSQLECSKCGDQTSDDIQLYFSDGSISCTTCFHACGVCKLAVLDDAVIIDNDSYHAQCFRCTVCNTRMDGAAFVKTSYGIYCNNCIEQRIAGGKKHQQNKKGRLAASSARGYETSSSRTELSPPSDYSQSLSLPTPIPFTRARSTDDLRSNHRRSQDHDPIERSPSISRSITQDSRATAPFMPPSDSSENSDPQKHRPVSNPAWATLEELLDKLVFSAVSRESRTFSTRFLLTYRRFATPRSVLLRLQKKMRELDVHASSDPMFVCYAQMSICRLLEDWIYNYPHDFVVRGALGALSALVKTIVAKTHLLSYGLQFVHFLDDVSSFVDQDTAWALKCSDHAEDSDDSEEDEQMTIVDTDSFASSSSSTMSHNAIPGSSPSSAKPVLSKLPERRQSISYLDKYLVIPDKSKLLPTDSTESSQRHILRDLLKTSQEISDMDDRAIAEEITRIETHIFLDIQPRHWLKHTLVSGFKDPESDTIARFGHLSNHIAELVVSLILSHDKPKARAKQIEKFIRIAVQLRGLNNYSALRALISGINAATAEGDETMAIVNEKYFASWKLLQSWDTLFLSSGSHSKYRMALSNTHGACIPALEVHILDLIRSHEGNNDYHEVDKSKINWGKYDMIGRFILGIVQWQEECRSSMRYNVPERPLIGDLLLKTSLMDTKMRQMRTVCPPKVSEFNLMPLRGNILT